MKQLLTLLALCFFSAPAHAQDVVIRTLCHYLPAHDGAEADYKPGVDASGKPVAPADIKPELKPIEYPLQIPVEIETLKFLGLEVVNDSVDMETKMALITVFEDGRVEYNGQDISDRASYACDDEKPAEIIAPPATIEPAATPPVPVEEPAKAPPSETKSTE